MMAFFLGLLISALLIICVTLEMGQFTRAVFSLIFLGGIIALGVGVFVAGFLLTPFFIAGMFINILAFIMIIPVLTGKENKDGRDESGH